MNSLFNTSITRILPLLLLIGGCAEKSDWGSIRVDRDSLGYLQASLENAKIKVRYGFGMGEEDPESFIRELFLKNHPHRNLAGVLIDGAAHRGLLTHAEIVRDNDSVKTVYLEWEPVPSKKKQFPGPARSEVSIFPDSAVLAIRYVDFCFPHICDIGLDTAQAIKTDWGGTMSVYGFNRDTLPQYEDCLFWRKYGDMGCDGVYALNGIEGNADQLSYKGWMVMAAYDPNGLGFGRIIPAENIRVIKLLWNKGFELFPLGKDYMGYIYFFDNGEDGALAMGKNLVDNMSH